MGFITNSADEVKGMNNLPGVPPGVSFQGPAIDPAGSATFYVDANGDDTAEGSAAAPFRTLQRAFDTIPDGFSGDCTIRMGAGTFSDSAILRALVNSDSAAIAVVGDTTGGFDISGQSFAFATNATATATVPAFTSFARGDRWLEPSSFPVGDLSGFGTPEFSGTTLEASTSPVLTATMGDPAVGNDAVGVRPFNTVIDAAYIGTRQPRVNLQLIGIDFGDGLLTREGCIFIACKATGTANRKQIKNCGGFLTVLSPSPSFAIEVSTDDANSWNSLSGAYEGSSIIYQCVRVFQFTTAVVEVASPSNAIIGRAGSEFSVSFLDVASSGPAIFLQSNAKCSSGGFLDFQGDSVALVQESSVLDFPASSSNHTGNVTDGIEAQSSSRIDGKAKLSAVVTSGTEVTAGTATGTYAGAAVVDNGAALSACT